MSRARGSRAPCGAAACPSRCRAARLETDELGHARRAQVLLDPVLQLLGAAAAPSFRTTAAATPSPHSTSGTPTTAASATAGCSSSTSSISPGERFSPPRTISRRCALRRTGSHPRRGSPRRWSGTSRPRRRGCAPEVFARDLLAAHADLAALARPDRLALGVADLELDARQRLADRREPLAHVRVGARGGVRWSAGPSTESVELVSVSP